MSDNWKVIVVEDTFDDVQVISTMLEFYAIEVHVAHNGTECLTLLGSLMPDLIITDLAMPEMDGWQTLAALRAEATTAHIPVVAVTAYHSAELAEEAVEAGFDAYFPKPVDPDTFINQLAAIFSG